LIKLKRIIGESDFIIKVVPISIIIVIVRNKNTYSADYVNNSNSIFFPESSDNYLFFSNINQMPTLQKVYKRFKFSPSGNMHFRKNAEFYYNPKKANQNIP